MERTESILPLCVVFFFPGCFFTSLSSLGYSVRLSMARASPIPSSSKIEKDPLPSSHLIGILRVGRSSFSFGYILSSLSHLSPSASFLTRAFSLGGAGALFFPKMVTRQETSLFFEEGGVFHVLIPPKAFLLASLFGFSSNFPSLLVIRVRPTSARYRLPIHCCIP